MTIFKQLGEQLQAAVVERREFLLVDGSGVVATKHEEEYVATL